jgi:predicted HAD superfamily Cof-like phosphohydrolase
MIGASPVQSLTNAQPLTNAQRVAEFHRAIGVQLPTSPTVPGAAELQLRLTLLEEEMAEVRQAAGALAETGQVAGVFPLAHELVDLLYVAYGAIEALGLDPDAAFAEIHRVNMHKAAGPRRADGKQLKPEGWQPADLGRLFAAQTAD